MISFFNGRTRSLGGETTEVFAKVDVSFRDYLHLLKGAHLGVFLAIALHSNEEGWAWPSYSTLAHETGYSEDTIRRALAYLCELEIDGHRILLRYQPKTDDGTFQSNRYLLFPSAEEVARCEGQGVAHLGAETGGGFDDRGGKTPPRLPWWENPTSENPTTKKNQLEPENKERKPGDPDIADASTPSEQETVVAARCAAGGHPRSGPSPPSPREEAPPDDDPVLAQVMDWYLAEISSRITPMVADDLRDLTRTQRTLDIWEFAFVASRNIGSQVNRWRYITTVVTEPDVETVEAWVESGKKRISRKAKTRRPRPPGGIDHRKSRSSTIARKPPAQPVDPDQVARDRARLIEHRRKREEQKNAAAAMR